MNDEDKKAYAIYESTILDREGYLYIAREAWQAACEYKQKEIDELKKEKDYLCQKMENMRFIYKDSEKLQIENAKLRECVEFYAKIRHTIKVKGSIVYSPERAKQCLKELEDM